MGFAASQARLLLLTARKSDLEFRAQQITNEEMRLAMLSEEIATEYSTKLSNQTLKYIDNSSGTSEMKELSASQIMALGGPKLQELVGGEWKDWSNNGSNDYSAQQLLQGVQNGRFRFMKADGSEEVQVYGGTAFAVTYDTSDDAAADAEYRSKTAALQVKEKRLQMELQQVEAQQKACEAEMDSVKKIMDKNIEKTFKVFS